MGLKRTKVRRRGFVLIIVLCTVIMLEVLLLGFNYRCRNNLRAVDHLQRSQQALNCARAGLNIAIAAIRDAPDIREDKPLPELFSSTGSLAVGPGQCSISLTEESSKLNVNLLKDKNGTLNRTRIDQVLRLIDLLNRQKLGYSTVSYGLVPAIIDWTDKDEQVTQLPFVQRENLGAESSYYLRLDPAYRCKNRPLNAIDEMLLIKEVTPEIFEHLRACLTVHGDGKVNINSAPQPVIESLCEDMDPAVAQMIIERRELKPFESIVDLRDVPGMTDSIYEAIKNTVTVSSEGQYYRVESRGNVGHLGWTIEAILRRNPQTKSAEVVFYRERR